MHSAARPFRLTVFAPALLLTACIGAPGLPAPATPRAPENIAAAQSLPSAADASWPGDGWWKDMGDPQLSGLIEEGLAHSPDVAAAEARLRRAQGLAQSAGAPLLPSVGVQGAVGEDKLSYNTYPSTFPKSLLPQGWNDTGQLAASLDWDIDLWGRNRAAFAAARSEREAAAIDAQQARLLLSSAIAVAYADFARLVEEVEVRKAALELREASRRIVTQRVSGGLDMLGSQRLSEAQASLARGELAAAQEALALRRHQIAALIAAGPDRGLALARPEWRKSDPQGLPEGVTTQLLVRRPDIAIARERMMAAAARVRMAKADFFPAIRLSALYGVQSLGLDQLFDSGSSFGRVGPIVSLPIFHGGSLRGRYRGARGSYDEAVADYDRTVLGAYQQAADAVTSRTAITARLEQAEAALASSEQAYAIARRRYEGGLSTYLDVLAVEDRLLQARLVANATRAADRAAGVALIRALGGGFAAPGDVNKDNADE
jgi:NodT family efflux transporter outer membrane factor (OMF) lipoprotein